MEHSNHHGGNESGNGFGEGSQFEVATSAPQHLHTSAHTNAYDNGNGSGNDYGLGQSRDRGRHENNGNSFGSSGLTSDGAGAGAEINNGANQSKAIAGPTYNYGHQNQSGMPGSATPQQYPQELPDYQQKYQPHYQQQQSSLSRGSGLDSATSHFTRHSVDETTNNLPIYGDGNPPGHTSETHQGQYSDYQNQGAYAFATNQQLQSQFGAARQAAHNGSRGQSPNQSTTRARSLSSLSQPREHLPPQLQPQQPLESHSKNDYTYQNQNQLHQQQYFASEGTDLLNEAPPRGTSSDAVQAGHGPVIELNSDDDDTDAHGPTRKRAKKYASSELGSPIPPASGLSAPAQKNSSFTSTGHSSSAAGHHAAYPRAQQGGLYGSNQVIPHDRPGRMYRGGNTKGSLHDFHSKVMKERSREAIRVNQSPPKFEDLPSRFTSTWADIIPENFTKPSEVLENWHNHQPKAFKLTLLDISYFTITGLPLRHSQIPSSTRGLRTKIKQLSRDHGKAIFEKVQGSTEGRWKIPLGAYQAFFTYLDADPMIYVEGIPHHLLKVASLGRARKEKGYPSAKKLISHGVPMGLANALAPFQRGGVDFVIEKRGRALVADEMGLGKTVQAIAGMSVYHKDWPVLILTPSSARYHWESEMQHWLGESSSVNAGKTNGEAGDSLKGKFGDDDGGDEEDEKDNDGDNDLQVDDKFQLLGDDQIRVLTSSKEPVFPTGRIRVVVCSYGLVPALIDCGKINAKTFKCAIVDESHMLKNMATKRTSSLVPFLQATNRCLLLSGTPAFAKPSELWPQLKILSGNDGDFWSDEKEFVHTYVKSDSPARRAELHAMLTGTVMIRRLKADILKTLPSKVREMGIVNVCNDADKRKFHHYLMLLKDGKGRLGKLARLQEKEDSRENISAPDDSNPFATDESDDDPLSKRNVLNKMFLLTARVKIPLLVELVKMWIADPSKGKLCLFAHHLFVLDDIMRLTNMNNAPNSDRKYIRIDGSTSPKERQAQIKSFQNDPTVRFAMLGITAAGVAVTLTACSTIWFTELFWTPALMIQAEDRCHRIGQLSRVKCLYIVAKGTLDDLLWRLLEAKFRDLGEFVEGKKKLKMVVHRTYQSEQELKTIFDEAAISDDEGEIKTDMDGEGGTGLKETDLLMLNDLAMDFEEMGKEEMNMITTDVDDDDDVDVTAETGRATNDSKDLSEQDESEGVTGSTEDAAIALSDDEERVDLSGEKEHKLMAPLTPLVSSTGKLNHNGSLLSCRVYTMMFSGQSYGMRMTFCEGRVVVGKRTVDCTQIKPDIGDILVAINGFRLPIVEEISQIIHHLRQCISQPPVQLMFAQNTEFSTYFQNRLAAIDAKKKAERAAKTPPASVIEIED